MINFTVANSAIPKCRMFNANYDILTMKKMEKTKPAAREQKLVLHSAGPKPG